MLHKLYEYCVGRCPLFRTDVSKLNWSHVWTKVSMVVPYRASCKLTSQFWCCCLLRHRYYKANGWVAILFSKYRLFRNCLFITRINSLVVLQECQNIGNARFMWSQHCYVCLQGNFNFRKVFANIDSFWFVLHFKCLNFFFFGNCLLWVTDN